MPMITLPDPGGRSSAYLSVPVAGAAAEPPWPGVVLVHDAFGLGDDMREQADWLATAGYLTVIPDLFDGRAAIRCLQGTFRQLFAQRGPVFDQIEATRVALAGRDDCTGSVGVIGYCMGGAFALLLAGRPGWQVAGVNYGMLPKNVDEVLSEPCPIVASFGAKDRGLRGAADRLRSVLADKPVAVDIKEYPEARHGFINRIAVASPLTPLLKVAGVGYDHDCAIDAKQRILAFFAAHLRDAPRPDGAVSEGDAPSPAGTVASG